MARKGRFPWFRLLILVVLLAAGTGFGAWYLKQPLAEPPEYRTAKVTRGDLTQVVTATGQLNPVVNVQVGSQISGIISKLYVDYNSIVKSNQVVAELDPATYKATVSQAKGNLANAQAGLELAQINARRAEELRKSDLIAQADYDNTVGNLHQAEASVQISKAALEKAQVDLDRCTIYAPIDGIVISRSVDVGQTVAASLSAPTLYIIANDLSKMQIDASISEADIGGIEMNQDVDFTVDAFPGRTFHGKVMQIRNSPITVQNVVTYDTVVAVKNDDLKLKPGMTANVSVIIAKRENALRIPNAAMRFKPVDNEDVDETRWDKLKSKLGIKSKEPKKTETAKEDTEKSKGFAGGEKSGPPGEGGGKRGPGGRGPGGFGGGGGRGQWAGKSRGDHSTSKTVYLLSTNHTATGEITLDPKATTIKTGINDGTYTEVTSGLEEGTEVVTGLIVQQAAGSSSSSQQSSNPFGSGRRRF